MLLNIMMHFTKLPYNERFAQLNSNKYAISEFNGQMPLYNGQAEGTQFGSVLIRFLKKLIYPDGPKS